MEAFDQLSPRWVDSLFLIHCAHATFHSDSQRLIKEAAFANSNLWVTKRYTL